MTRSRVFLQLSSPARLQSTRGIHARASAATTRRAIGYLGGIALAVAAMITPSYAFASCVPVAQAPGGGLIPAALRGGVPAALPFNLSVRRIQAGPSTPKAGTVDLTFLGHSSFLIRTAQDVTAVTDYNGYVRAGFTPDIVTMNHAHSSHYTEFVEPGVKHVLRGWITAAGLPVHDVKLRDLRVRNVTTNIRGGERGAELAGNSIFIFETAGLCIAHLGHLHHALTPQHLGRIGAVDVVLAPIDDGLTMSQAEMAAAVYALRPKIVIPMHFSEDFLVTQFISLMRDKGFRARRLATINVRLSKRTLPPPTVMVLAGGMF
jgi:L-ascorbate metabolism protein UlaG (beta-lactamase superfamily)